MAAGCMLTIDQADIAYDVSVIAGTGPMCRFTARRLAPRPPRTGSIARTTRGPRCAGRSSPAVGRPDVSMLLLTLASLLAVGVVEQ